MFVFNVDDLFVRLGLGFMVSFIYYFIWIFFFSRFMSGYGVFGDGDFSIVLWLVLLNC